MTIRRKVLSIVAVALLALPACGGGDGDDDAAGDDSSGDGAAQSAASVEIKNTAFNPDKVSVKAGESVRWSWNDGGLSHSVTGESFDSKVKSSGDFSHTFEEAGTFGYACTVHSAMTGEVTVT